MSGHHVTHVNHYTRSIPWTDEQHELLVLHWRTMTDRDLAKLLSGVGPKRTEGGVQDRRIALGFRRPRGFAQPEVRAKARVAQERRPDPANDWPHLKGTQEARDKEYLRRLYEGLQIEKARALAQQEVA